MSDLSWDDIMQRVMEEPEGGHLQIQLDAHSLLLERRGDVLIALRDITSSEHDLASWLSTCQASLACPDGQVLRVGESLYICHWRRRPTDSAWLVDLMSIEL